MIPMCGRFTLRSRPHAIAEAFGVPHAFDLRPRYNIAPSQSVAVVRLDPEHQRRELTFLQWDLVPSWADDPKSGIINARSETAATKPSFRVSFKSRRCLVVADRFYEWLED
jgi:putative SOS response-associated peptidase YedK